MRIDTVRLVRLGLLLSTSLCAQEGAATVQFTGMGFSIPTGWHRADVSIGVKLAPVGLPEKQDVKIVLFPSGPLDADLHSSFQRFAQTVNGLGGVQSLGATAVRRNVQGDEILLVPMVVRKEAGRQSYQLWAATQTGNNVAYLAYTATDRTVWDQYLPKVDEFLRHWVSTAPANTPVAPHANGSDQAGNSAPAKVDLFEGSHGNISYQFLFRSNGSYEYLALDRSGQPNGYSPQTVCTFHHEGRYRFSNVQLWLTPGRLISAGSPACLQKFDAQRLLANSARTFRWWGHGRSMIFEDAPLADRSGAPGRFAFELRASPPAGHPVDSSAEYEYQRRALEDSHKARMTIIENMDVAPCTDEKRRRGECR